jgi:hypothetical protein
MEEETETNVSSEAQSDEEAVIILDFGRALQLLKKGYLTQRAGWSGKGKYIKLQIPEENSRIKVPYIYISTDEGKLIPWTASQADMLAEDWDLV